MSRRASDPLVEEARRNVVPALLLATAVQASTVLNKSDVVAELSEEAFGRLSNLDLSSAAQTMRRATDDVKSLVEEAGCKDENEFVLASAVATCILHVSQDDCPPSARHGLEILMSTLLGSSDKFLDGAARAAMAMTLRCKQLHGNLH
jgi:hypothetical protein